MFNYPFLVLQFVFGSYFRGPRTCVAREPKYPYKNWNQGRVGRPGRGQVCRGAAVRCDTLLPRLRLLCHWRCRAWQTWEKETLLGRLIRCLLLSAISVLMIRRWHPGFLDSYFRREALGPTADFRYVAVANDLC